MDQARIDTDPVWGWSTDAPVWNSNHTSGTATDIMPPGYVPEPYTLRRRIRDRLDMIRDWFNFRARIARWIISRLGRIIFRLERWS